MKKKIWKRFLAVGCASSLFMMAPGITVLADDMQNEETVGFADDEEGLSQASEGVYSEPDENADALQAENSIPDDYLEEDSDAAEETAGAGTVQTFQVGDGVTAILDVLLKKPAVFAIGRGK